MTKVTGSFTSVNGSVTVTVDGLSEIKKIFVNANSSDISPCDTSIDLTDEDLPICTTGSTSGSYGIYGFKGNPDNVSGNTFTWYWNGTSTRYYVAYGK